MAVDIEKVSMLTGFVERFIQLKGVEHELNEDVISDLISQALMITGATYSDEELDAAKRDITWKYQIYTSPGQSILADYDMDDWYEDAKADIVPTFWTRYKNYLIDKKHFSPSVVSTLGEDTLDQKLMNYMVFISRVPKSLLLFFAFISFTLKPGLSMRASRTMLYISEPYFCASFISAVVSSMVLLL